MKQKTRPRKESSTSVRYERSRNDAYRERVLGENDAGTRGEKNSALAGSCAILVNEQRRRQKGRSASAARFRTLRRRQKEGGGGEGTPSPISSRIVRCARVTCSQRWRWRQRRGGDLNRRSDETKRSEQRRRHAETRRCRDCEAETSTARQPVEFSPFAGPVDVRWLRVIWSAEKPLFFFSVKRSTHKRV